MGSASAAWRSAPALFVTVRVRPPVLSRIARPVPVLLDHAIVLDRRSAGDGNGDAAPTHLQVTGRADHARSAVESLCGGDGAGDWVRAGNELGSPRRRSEKSESDQRGGKEDFHSAALLGQRLSLRHSLTVTIVQQRATRSGLRPGVNRN